MSQREDPTPQHHDLKAIDKPLVLSSTPTGENGNANIDFHDNSTNNLIRSSVVPSSTTSNSSLVDTTTPSASLSTSTGSAAQQPMGLSGGGVARLTRAIAEGTVQGNGAISTHVAGSAAGSALSVSQSHHSTFHATLVSSDPTSSLAGTTNITGGDGPSDATRDKDNSVLADGGFSGTGKETELETKVITREEDTVKTNTQGTTSSNIISPSLQTSSSTPVNSMTVSSGNKNSITPSSSLSVESPRRKIDEASTSNANVSVLNTRDILTRAAISNSPARQSASPSTAISPNTSMVNKRSPPVTTETKMQKGEKVTPLQLKDLVARLADRKELRLRSKVFLSARNISIYLMVIALSLLVGEQLFVAISSEAHTLKWLFIYCGIIGAFLVFSSPFHNHADDGPPSYFSLSYLYITWLFFATVYHLPMPHQLGIDIKLSISMYLSIYLATLVALVLYHILYILIASLAHRFAPSFATRKFVPRSHLASSVGVEELWVANKNAMLIALACCVSYSHCGNAIPTFTYDISRMPYSTSSTTGQSSPISDSICLAHGSSASSPRPLALSPFGTPTAFVTVASMRELMRSKQVERLIPFFDPVQHYIIGPARRAVWGDDAETDTTTNELDTMSHEGNTGHRIMKGEGDGQGLVKTTSYRKGKDKGQGKGVAHGVKRATAAILETAASAVVRLVESTKPDVPEDYVPDSFLAEAGTESMSGGESGNHGSDNPVTKETDTTRINASVDVLHENNGVPSQSPTIEEVKRRKRKEWRERVEKTGIVPKTAGFIKKAGHAIADVIGSVAQVIEAAATLTDSERAYRRFVTTPSKASPKHKSMNPNPTSLSSPASSSLLVPPPSCRRSQLLSEADLLEHPGHCSSSMPPPTASSPLTISTCASPSSSSSSSSISSSSTIARVLTSLRTNICSVWLAAHDVNRYHPVYAALAFYGERETKPTRAIIGHVLTDMHRANGGNSSTEMSNINSHINSNSSRSQDDSNGTHKGNPGTETNSSTVDAHYVSAEIEIEEEPPAYLSPVWMLWTTLVAIYYINYFFERSASWALSHIRSYETDFAPAPSVATVTNADGVTTGQITASLMPSTTFSRAGLGRWRDSQVALQLLSAKRHFDQVFQERGLMRGPSHSSATSSPSLSFVDSSDHPSAPLARRYSSTLTGPAAKHQARALRLHRASNNRPSLDVEENTGESNDTKTSTTSNHRAPHNSHSASAMTIHGVSAASLLYELNARKGRRGSHARLPPTHPPSRTSNPTVTFVDEGKDGQTTVRLSRSRSSHSQRLTSNDSNTSPLDHPSLNLTLAVPGKGYSPTLSARAPPQSHSPQVTFLPSSSSLGSPGPLNRNRLSTSPLRTSPMLTRTLSTHSTLNVPSFVDTLGVTPALSRSIAARLHSTAASNLRDNHHHDTVTLASPFVPRHRPALPPAFVSTISRTPWKIPNTKPSLQLTRAMSDATSVPGRGSTSTPTGAFGKGGPERVSSSSGTNTDQSTTSAPDDDVKCELITDMEHTDSSHSEHTSDIEMSSLRGEGTYEGTHHRHRHRLAQDPSMNQEDLADDPPIDVEFVHEVNYEDPSHTGFSRRSQQKGVGSVFAATSPRAGIDNGTVRRLPTSPSPKVTTLDHTEQPMDVVESMPTVTNDLTTIPPPPQSVAPSPLGHELGSSQRVIVQFDHIMDRPHFLPMVTWFSVTSWDIWKTLFDLVVSFKLFLGRLDQRVLQAAVYATPGSNPSSAGSLTHSSAHPSQPSLDKTIINKQQEALQALQRQYLEMAQALNVVLATQNAMLSVPRPLTVPTLPIPSTLMPMPTSLPTLPIAPCPTPSTLVPAQPALTSPIHLLPGAVPPGSLPTIDIMASSAQTDNNLTSDTKSNATNPADLTNNTANDTNSGALLSDPTPVARPLNSLDALFAPLQLASPSSSSSPPHAIGTITTPHALQGASNASTDATPTQVISLPSIATPFSVGMSTTPTASFPPLPALSSTSTSFSSTSCPPGPLNPSLPAPPPSTTAFPQLLNPIPPVPIAPSLPYPSTTILPTYRVSPTTSQAGATFPSSSYVTPAPSPVAGAPLSTGQASRPLSQAASTNSISTLGTLATQASLSETWQDDGTTFTIRGQPVSTPRSSASSSQPIGGEEAEVQEDSQGEELWFDWMADTGDGGASTYTIARLMAQPLLNVPISHARRESLGIPQTFFTATQPKESTSVSTTIHLPRAKMIMIGGDLAYPNPTAENYQDRFILPFEYALAPPPGHDNDSVAVSKPDLPYGCNSLNDYKGPVAMVMSGNHDWMDSLSTYGQFILGKNWLGGWLLPQTRSYFALSLPAGWWVFAIDLALMGDLDSQQFKYFATIAETRMGPQDRAIVCTHEPSWTLSWYEGSVEPRNLMQLLTVHLRGRCKLRLAGDIHHYTRHSFSRPTPTATEVSGQGKVESATNGVSVAKAPSSTELARSLDPSDDHSPGPSEANLGTSFTDTMLSTLSSSLATTLKGLLQQKQNESFSEKASDSIPSKLIANDKGAVALSSEAGAMLSNEETAIHEERKEAVNRHINRTVGSPVSQPSAESQGDRAEVVDGVDDEEENSMASRSSSFPYPEHLVTSGGGGAFLHPTHPFAFPLMYEGGQVFHHAVSYPSAAVSRGITFNNVLKFRKKNWRFDVLGGLIYFLVICSMLPLCGVTHYLFAEPLDFLPRVFGPSKNASSTSTLDPFSTSSAFTNFHLHRNTSLSPEQELSAILSATVPYGSIHPAHTASFSASRLHALLYPSSTPHNSTRDPPPLSTNTWGPASPISFLSPPDPSIPTLFRAGQPASAFLPLYLFVLFWYRITLVILSVIASSIVNVNASLLGMSIIAFGFYSFCPSVLKPSRRLFLGSLHVFAHIWSALLIAVLLEVCAELCIAYGIFAKSGLHSLYDSYRVQEERLFSDPNGFRKTLSQITFGLYPACIKGLMMVFDVPEYYAFTRAQICRAGTPNLFEGLSRLASFGYYLAFFLYYWLLSTPVFAFILGCYLFVALNYFLVHWDEGFSSMRIPHFKSFLRFKIDARGDLHVFCIGVDRVARAWRSDPCWRQTPEQLRATLEKLSAAEQTQDKSSSIQLQGLLGGRKKKLTEAQAARVSGSICVGLDTLDNASSRPLLDQALGRSPASSSDPDTPQFHMPYMEARPSRWLPDVGQPDAPAIVDYFCVRASDF